MGLKLLYTRAFILRRRKNGNYPAQKSHAKHRKLLDSMLCVANRKEVVAAAVKSAFFWENIKKGPNGGQYGRLRNKAFIPSINPVLVCKRSWKQHIFPLLWLIFLRFFIRIMMNGDVSRFFSLYTSIWFIQNDVSTYLTLGHI